MKFKAIIFDMDGTIVDSDLDFEKMRSEIGLKDSLKGILEYIEELSIGEANKAMQIIHEHEKEGALKSIIMRDFKDFYYHLKRKRIPTGILTRNSKEVTKLTIQKHDLEFDLILSRDCCAAKPHPEGLFKFRDQFSLNDEDILYIGDYRFDLETAKNANMKSALILNDANREFENMADIAFKQYIELKNFV